MESSPTSQDILEPLEIFEAGNSERMADGVFVASACHGRFSSAPLQLWRSLSVDRRIVHAGCPKRYIQNYFGSSLIWKDSTHLWKKLAETPSGHFYVFLRHPSCIYLINSNKIMTHIWLIVIIFPCRLTSIIQDYSNQSHIWCNPSGIRKCMRCQNCDIIMSDMVLTKNNFCDIKF